jgi:hypothetical protein
MCAIYSYTTNSEYLYECNNYEYVQSMQHVYYVNHLIVCILLHGIFNLVTCDGKCKFCYITCILGFVHTRKKISLLYVFFHKQYHRKMKMSEIDGKNIVVSLSSELYET